MHLAPLNDELFPIYESDPREVLSTIDEIIEGQVFWDNIGRIFRYPLYEVSHAIGPHLYKDRHEAALKTLAKTIELYKMGQRAIDRLADLGLVSDIPDYDVPMGFVTDPDIPVEIAESILWSCRAQAASAALLICNFAKAGSREIVDELANIWFEAENRRLEYLAGLRRSRPRFHGPNSRPTNSTSCMGVLNLAARVWLRHNGYRPSATSLL